MTNAIAPRRALVWSTAAGFALCLGVLAAADRGRAQEVDINAIFSCDAAKTGGQSAGDCAATRDSILQNCTSCHSFVPIVKAQKTPDEWDATIGVHRERLPDLAPPQFTQIRTFLVAHFNPSNPPPTLPPELEALGLGQAN